MKSIIACIDGSVVGDAVCDAAVWASQKLGKKLLLLHCIEKQPQHGADDLSGSIGLGAQSELLEKMAQLDQERSKLSLRLGKSLLASAMERSGRQPDLTIDTRLRHGDFVEALVELEDEARLMVVGKTGLDHGGTLTAIGSHIETLIRQVQTSILIASAPFTAPRNFMLAYDGNETADRSLSRIIQGGLLNDLPCHLVMVKHGQATQEKLDSAARRLQEEGFVVTAALLEGPVFEALQNYKTDHNIGLMVMGAFSHSKVRHLFLGSNTLRMIERADLPLIVLR